MALKNPIYGIGDHVGVKRVLGDAHDGYVKASYHSMTTPSTLLYDLVDENGHALRVGVPENFLYRMEPKPQPKYSAGTQVIFEPALTGSQATCELYVAKHHLVLSSVFYDLVDKHGLGVSTMIAEGSLLPVPTPKFSKGDVVSHNRLHSDDGLHICVGTIVGSYLPCGRTTLSYEVQLHDDKKLVILPENHLKMHLPTPKYTLGQQVLTEGSNMTWEVDSVSRMSNPELLAQGVFFKYNLKSKIDSEILGELENRIRPLTDEKVYYRIFQSSPCQHIPTMEEAIKEAKKQGGNYCIAKVTTFVDASGVVRELHE